VTFGSDGASLPFTDSDATPDNSVAFIAVDMYADPGVSLAAGDTWAQACVYSGWAVHCGLYLASPAIGSGSHGSISLTGQYLDAWTQDTGNGYAYVFLAGYPGVTADYAGVYLHN
jgi:hypothetical protein